MKKILSALFLLACSYAALYAQNPITDSIQLATTNDEIRRLPDLIKDPQNRKYLSMADKHHRYPIHYFVEQFYSPSNYSEDAFFDWASVYKGLRAMIEYGPGLNDWVNGKHPSAYAYIIENAWLFGDSGNYGPVIAQLIEFGANPYYKPKAKLMSPIEMAIDWELYDLILAWKLYGVRYDLPLSKEENLSVLGKTISNFSTYDILSALLDSTNANHLEYGGTKSLLDLAEGDNASEVLWQGFDVNQRFNKPPFETPLHRSAMRGEEDLMGTMLWAGADVNAQDLSGETPLIWAIRAGQGEPAFLLIASGADPTTKTANGQSALELAKKTLKKDADYIQLIEDGISTYVEFKSENPVYTLDLNHSGNIGFLRPGFEIARLVFEKAESGELTMFGPEHEILGPAELQEQRIKTEMGSLEMPLEWIEGETYWGGDIVSYNGIYYEAVDFPEEEPSEDSWEWFVVDMTPDYFQWSEISILKYNLKASPELEFFVPAEFTPEGVERFIGSVDLEEAVIALNNTDALWYEDRIHDQKGGKGIYFYPDVFLFKGMEEWDFTEESSLSKQLLDSYYTGIIPMQEAKYKYRIDQFLEEVIEGSDNWEVGAGPEYNFPRSFNSILQIHVMDNSTLDVNIVEGFEGNEGHDKLGTLRSRDLWVLTDTSRVSRVLRMGEALKCYECLDFVNSDQQLVRFLTPYVLKPTEGIQMSTVLEESITTNNDPEWNALNSQILEASLDGSIQSYMDENMLQAMTLEEVEENLRKSTTDDVFLEMFEPVPWETEQAYLQGEMVLYDGQQYESTIDENSGNIPSTESPHWRQTDNTEYLFWYQPQDVYSIKLYSKMIFDNNGQIINIEPVSLGLVAFVEPSGDYYELEHLIGYFKYEDLQALSLGAKLQKLVEESSSRGLTDFSTLRKGP